MKRNFVKLVRLADLVWNGASAEDNIKWKLNVLNSVGEDAYGLADADGDYIVREFSTDEIEFVELECFNFMGSVTEQERFYAADYICVMERATGDYYAYETQEIFEGAF